MTPQPFEPILRHIHRLAAVPAAEGPGDAELLRRFAVGDGTAFAALVGRHGPMVLGVCRRLLSGEQDVEDAFQATFLVLARRAKAIRKPGSVGSWLYGVAYRVASRVRAHGRRCPTRAVDDLPAATAEPWVEASDRELRVAIDEELHRLPEKYRAPVVLCCLEGHSRPEAARQLGCGEGTVSSRLARGRALLQSRLARRGWVVPAAAGALLWEQTAAPAAVPAALAVATVRCAGLLATGEAAFAGGASARVLSLADGAIRGLAVARAKLAGVLLLAGVAALTVGVAVRQVPATSQQQSPPPRGQADATPAPPAAGHIDVFGDPLPPGAVTRLGSVRLRQSGVESLVFAADGKTMVATGGDLRVRTWDVATGKLVRATRLEGTVISRWGVVLSPDGKTAACWDGRAVYLWDAQSGKLRKQWPAPRSPYQTLFRVGNRTVFLWLAPREPVLLDCATGTQRQLTLPAEGTNQGTDGTYHAAFSPDGKLLVTGAGRHLPLCLWDVATGELVRRLDANPNVSAFSRDGKVLATVGRATEALDSDSVLRLLDVGTGRELRRVRLPGRDSYWSIEFAPDGRHLALADEIHASVLDLRTGKELARFAGRNRMLSFSPDGRIVALRGANRIHLWDWRAGKELCARPGNDDWANAVAYSPDGTLLATTSWLDDAVGLWDATTGRLLRRLSLGADCRYVVSLTFSSDGRKLAVGRWQGEFELLDVRTGRILHKLALIDPKQPQSLRPHIERFDLSPDGRRVITTANIWGPTPSAEVAVWDLETGKKLAGYALPRAPSPAWVSRGGRVALLGDAGIHLVDTQTGWHGLRVPGAWGPPLSGSPGGELLDAMLPFGANPADARAVRVWEAATGREVATVPVGPTHLLALGADQRTLVTADERALRVWDLATGKERYHLAFPAEFVPPPGSAFVSGLYLSPDGRRATTALGDGTLLVWDVPALPRRSVPAFDDREASRLWEELADSRAAGAYRAVWTLDESPAAAVALLRRRLGPVRAPDPVAVRRLIRDLDNPSFRVREAASRDLANMGAAAAPALRQARADRPSPEMRRRLEELLARATDGVPAPAVLRRLRAIGVLEQAGSGKARQLLKEIAGGMAEAAETRAAKVALERLGR